MNVSLRVLRHRLVVRGEFWLGNFRFVLWLFLGAAASGTLAKIEGAPTITIPMMKKMRMRREFTG